MLRPSPVRTVVSSLTAQRKFKTDAAEQFADASTQAQAPWQGCNASHLVEEDRACELINLGVFAEKFELLQNHLVLVVLCHQLAERLSHLLVLCV